MVVVFYISINVLLVLNKCREKNHNRVMLLVLLIYSVKWL